MGGAIRRYGSLSRRVDNQYCRTSLDDLARFERCRLVRLQWRTVHQRAIGASEIFHLQGRADVHGDVPARHRRMDHVDIAILRAQ